MQSVPDQPDTMVVIESTANGYDEFKDLWDDAVDAWGRGERDGFMPIFFAWWEMPEYRRPVPADFQPTEEEEAIKATYHLDDEQLVWRRWCIRNNCGGDLDLFRQEYPASPDEAFVASGRCIFDQAALILRRQQVRNLERSVGRFVYDYDGSTINNIRWVDAWDGEIIIYQEPEDGHPYVIGADTAGEGSDFFVGQVLDNATGRQVAVLRQESGEGEFVRQLYCLGRYYHDALLGVEANFSTFPNTELERLGYRNLYVRETLDNYTNKPRQSYGFRTDLISRPLIISELVELAAAGAHSGSRDTGRDADLCPERGRESRGPGGEARRLRYGPGDCPPHPPAAEIHRGGRQGGGRRGVGRLHVGGLQQRKPGGAGIPD